LRDSLPGTWRRITRVPMTIPGKLADRHGH
jgi:hypothetical protein